MIFDRCTHLKLLIKTVRLIRVQNWAHIAMLSWTTKNLVECKTVPCRGITISTRAPQIFSFSFCPGFATQPSIGISCRLSHNFCTPIRSRTLLDLIDALVTSASTPDLKVSAQWRRGSAAMWQSRMFLWVYVGNEEWSLSLLLPYQTLSLSSKLTLGLTRRIFVLVTCEMVLFLDNGGLGRVDTEKT